MSGHVEEYWKFVLPALCSVENIVALQQEEGGLLGGKCNNLRILLIGMPK